MRITMAALGTRGDVQPMIALGRGLRAGGHDVTLVAGSDFGEWVTSHGLGFVPALDMEALMHSEDGLAWAAGDRDPRKQLGAMRALFDDHRDALVRPLLETVGDTDVYVSGFTASPFVQAIGERHAIPVIDALLQPQFRTRSGSASVVAIRPGDSVLNRWAGALAERMLWSTFRDASNALRRELGLDPHDFGSYLDAAHRTPVIYGVSRQILPPAADWDAPSTVTGYWFLDKEAAWRPPPELTAFLDAGPAPVYVGFGSMALREPERMLRLIVDAARQARTRMIVATGWSGAAAVNVPDDVLVIKAAPHDWLFPRVAATVHHGGAGTTGASLCAGRPLMVVPFMADQPYWGRRVAELGVGVRPVAARKLTAEALAAGIRQLSDDAGMQERARTLGESIRAERGVDVAVAAIADLTRARESLRAVG